jgi:hypothetical protein
MAASRKAEELTPVREISHRKDMGNLELLQRETLGILAL